MNPRNQPVFFNKPNTQRLPPNFNQGNRSLPDRTYSPGPFPHFLHNNPPPQHPNLDRGHKPEQSMNPQQMGNSFKRPRFQEMTEDLAKLKKQLNDMMVNTGQKVKPYNKSSDNLFAPHQRLQHTQYHPHPNNNGPHSNFLPHKANLPNGANLDSSQGRNPQMGGFQELATSHAEKRQNRNLEEQSIPDQGKKQIGYKNSGPSTNISKVNKEVGQLDETDKKAEKRKESKNDTIITEQFMGGRGKATSLRQNGIHQSMEKRNYQVELQKMEIQFRSQLQKLALERSNLKDKNDMLMEENQRIKVKLAEIQTKLKTVQEENYNIKSKQRLLKEKIGDLQAEIVDHKSSKRTSFDHLLKDQLEETAKARDQLGEKNDQITRLNDIILTNRRKAEQAINEGAIQKLKYISEIKQLQQTSEIQILNKDNQIKTLKHCLETMDSKLQTAIRDNKAKDEFLQQHLVGRLKTGQEQAYVHNMLSKYEIEFPVSNILEKLLEEQKIISHLRQQLGQQ